MSEDARRFFAAVPRNRDFIFEILSRLLPSPAQVVEIASGSGEHAVHMASKLPHITWQPTEADADLLASINAWQAHENLSNMKPGLRLNVLDPHWPIPSADAVVNINMIHISPWRATEALFKGVSSLLPVNGLLYMYGPYKREGRHTAPSNEQFDNTLKSMNPNWGVRNLEDVRKVASQHALELIEVIDMPANNLSVIYRRQ
jgi:hypothetical protein